MQRDNEWTLNTSLKLGFSHVTVYTGQAYQWIQRQGDRLL